MPAPKGAFITRHLRHAWKHALIRILLSPRPASPAFDVVGRKPPAISPRNLFFRRTAFGAGTIALQPSEELLFSRKHIARLVAQLAHNPIARLGKPRDAMRLASILFFVGAFAAPVEDGGAALFPIAHGVPVASFVGTQALMSAEAGVVPELGDLVEAGINSRGDALPFRVAGAQQQNVPPRLDVAHQSADSLHRIGGNQGLFGKNVLELLVILVGECQVVRLFDLEAAFVRLANAAAAGAFHAIAQLI